MRFYIKVCIRGFPCSKLFDIYITQNYEYITGNKFETNIGIKLSYV